MRNKRCVRVLDVENAIDRSWIGQMGDLDQPRQDDPYFVLTTKGQSMNMKAVAVVPDGNKLRVTTTQGEIFVFETVSEDEYGLLGNGRMGEWYTEVEEQLATEEKWLLIHHPVLFPNEVRIPLSKDNAVVDVNQLCAALLQTAYDMEKK